MANKYTGLGWTVKLNSTAVANIRSISHSEASGSPVDVTVMEDMTTSDRYMRKKSGVIDPGQLNLGLAYDPVDGTMKALQALMDSGSTATFTVIAPTTTITEVFGGIVMGLGREVPWGELVTASVRIEKTGAPGWSTLTS